ncbi:hypothetical protein [Pyrolobus fumarii]|uniref:hypothetical protein n=1 Tax=Pyrolobus fumarii TaxID=54252 RepID=UPI00064E2AC9|nr:hypothetical protein [Pyrolobus fumarii]
MRLRKRLWRACLSFTPCMVIVYNLGPLIVGFMGGLAGALLPLLVVEAAAPDAVKHAMTVLANAAAGASAGIAAATARRPARVVIRGLEALRVGASSIRVEALAVNESNVTSRDVTVYTSGFKFEGFNWVLTAIEERGVNNLFLVDIEGEECCICPGCSLEGVELGRYRVKTIVRAPTHGLRVRGVRATTMPPRSLLEAPLVEVEVMDLRGCDAWLDCSTVRRCGFRDILESVDSIVLARVLSGGEALAILAAPVDTAWMGSIRLVVEVTGDPVPSDQVEVDVYVNIERADSAEWLVKLRATTEEGLRVERWFHLHALRCVRESALPAALR